MLISEVFFIDYRKQNSVVHQSNFAGCVWRVIHPAIEQRSLSELLVLRQFLELTQD